MGLDFNVYNICTLGKYGKKQIILAIGNGYLVYIFKKM